VVIDLGDVRRHEGLEVIGPSNAKDLHPRPAENGDDRPRSADPAEWPLRVSLTSSPTCGSIAPPWTRHVSHRIVRSASVGSAERTPPA